MGNDEAYEAAAVKAESFLLPLRPGEIDLRVTHTNAAVAAIADGIRGLKTPPPPPVAEEPEPKPKKGVFK